MAITTINSLAIPAGTVVSADLTYPLTGFSSTGIDDNATSTAITIDSSENVGIGTASPGAKFDVKGSARIERDGSSTLLQFTDTGVSSRWIGMVDGTSRFAIYGTNGSTEEFVIDSSGNVGIGTTSPSTILANVSASAKGLAIESAVPAIAVKDTSAADDVGYIYQNANDFHFLNYAGGDTIFSYGSSYTEAMRIDSSGRVGIGTASPTEALHVKTSAANTTMLVENSSSQARYSVDTDGPYIYALTSGDSALRVFGESTERMRIDSSGNVGIGTSTINSGFVVDLGSLTVPAAGASTSCAMFGNSGSNGLYGTQIGALSTGTGYIQVQRADGTASTYDLLLQPNGGNVGIGTTSPSATLDLVGPSPTPVVLEINSANSNCDVTMQSASTSTATRLRNGTNDFQVHTNGTERMRIDSSGNLLVGCTSAMGGGGSDGINGFGVQGSGGGRFVALQNTTDANMYIAKNSGYTSSNFIFFYAAGTKVGSIYTNGTTTTYATSSDKRLKENIVDAPAGNIDAIRVRSFDWKADGSHQTYGMVAQELVDVVPEAVAQGETEDDMWGVDYSKLVPMMIKEIQDLKAEVAALKGA